MSVAVGTYVSFKMRDGGMPPAPFNVQNFHYNETRTYETIDYTYGAFGFSGGVLDAEAANIEASLVFQVNEVNLNFAVIAAQNLYLAEVKTVWLDPVSLIETAKRLVELYAVVGFEHDNSRLSLRLGSPLDSVGGDIPRRKLSQELVGALPSTGNITFV